MRRRGPKLQRLFSSFPSGAPGIGLLLLRATVGIALIGQGALSLGRGTGPSGVAVIAGALILVGLAFLTGSLTPAAAGLAATLVTALVLAPAASLDGLGMGSHGALLLVMAAAVGLLGPGAYSVDARLFGRREIEVPRGGRRGE